EWTGYRFGDPSVELRPEAVGAAAGFRSARERADALLSNRTLLPAFDLSDDGLREMVRAITSAAPVLVEGDAEVLDFLARYIERTAERPARPRAILSSGQTLPAS